jgi:hypothetical protein
MILVRHPPPLQAAEMILCIVLAAGHVHPDYTYSQEHGELDRTKNRAGLQKWRAGKYPLLQ